MLISLNWIRQYADLPAEPLRVAYGASQHAATARRLEETIAHIASLPADGFAQCDSPSACRFCCYAGYCGNAGGRDTAGEDAAAGDEEAWDWSDVPEYEY